MKKFLLVRRSIIEEGWWVTAESEQEAMDKAYEGQVDNDECDRREWCDYYDDEWTVDDVEELDDLVLFVKSLDKVTT